MNAPAGPAFTNVARTTGRPWPERLATMGVFFANGLGIGAWAAAIPRFQAGLGLNEGELSLALLSFAVGAVATMPLVGMLGAHVRTGPATWLAGLAFTLALATPAVAPSLVLLCLAAVVLGAGNGAVDVLMNAHASGIERRWGRPIMSSFHAAFSLGGVAGALLGGWVGAADPAMGLWLPSLVSSACVLVAAGVLRDQGHASPPTPLARPSRDLLALCWLALLCMLIEGAVADWSGAYLARSQVSPGLVASGYAAFSLLMVAGRLIGDPVIERLGPASTVRAGGLLAAGGLAVVVAVPSLVGGVIGFGLVGLGLSNVVPAIFSAAGRAGASAASGVAMAATAGYSGFLIGPVAIGALASATNLRWGMTALALAALAVAALSATRKLR